MRKNILLAFFMAVAFHGIGWAATETGNHWSCDPSLYPNNMTIIGVVEIDGAEQGNTSLEVGAFCGTECRGSEMLLHFPQVERYLVFLTVYGEDNDAITFKLYDHGTEEELDAYIDSMTFTINAMHGTPIEPYEFNFIPYYNVIVAANPTEAGNVAGGGHLLAHEQVTLTATPNTGYGFVNWTENGVVVGTEPTLQFENLGDRSLVANFEMIMHHVDVGVNFDVAGLATGSGDFQEGSTVTVSATANNGFQFDRWTESGETVSTDASYTFAIWEDRDLTAEFKLAITDTTAFSCVEYDWHGQNYTESGIYYDTLSSYLGIDSIVALHLTIYPAYAYNLYETACDSFLWNDTYYYESGDYEDAHQSVYGCDSIYTLHLTINQTRPLGNFTYMMPANNYINRYTDVEFYWDGVANADQYDFYFWEDGNDRPTDPTIANSTSVTAQRSGLEHGITYHWCVVAKNECVEIESPERTFVCQLTPAMSVIPQSSLDFGEVEVGQSSSKNIAVSAIALSEDISYSFLENEEYGADAAFFNITPSSNWNALKGGTLQVTFTPVAEQLYYNSAIRIASGAFVDTIYFTGSMANRYVFTTNVDGDVFTANDSITITGHVADVLGNVVPNLDVDVYLLVLGTRLTQSVVSDENGDYSITYVPRYSESGYYQVGSCEKYKRETAVHDSFDVPGMSRTTSDYIIWDLYQNDTLTGSIPIRNRSRLPLGNIQVIPVTVPDGFEINFDNFSLGALETGELHYTLTGTEVSTGNNYLEATFQIFSSDGTTLNLTCYYYCRQRRGDLDVYPPSVTTSMKRYGQKVLSFQVTNNGNAETGAISIDLPDVTWMRVMGADTLPSLAVGDSLSFSLMLSPDENVPLGPYSGNFAVNCANGLGFSVPYSLEATSDSTGVLVVDVTDDYTYNTNDGHGPHLAGASVTVIGYYSLETVAQGYTDDQGVFMVDTIPEGWYYLTVRATSHAEYNKGVIYIEGGKTNQQDIYLQFQAISYSWEVVPTEVEDEYEFVLVTDIKTNVPVPVVVIEGPSVFDTIAYGDTLQYHLTVSNKGLVDAYDIQVVFETDFAEYVFTPMFDHIDTLHPHSAVIIPCIMTRIQNGRGAADSDLCKYGREMSLGWYHCNLKREWVKHESTFMVKAPDVYCVDYSAEDIIAYMTNVYEYFGGINGLNLPGGGGGHHNPGHSPVTPPIETVSQDCTPCVKLILDAVDMAIPQIDLCALWDWAVHFDEKIDFYANIKNYNAWQVLSHVVSDVWELVTILVDFYNLPSEIALYNHIKQNENLLHDPWFDYYDNNMYNLNGRLANYEYDSNTIGGGGPLSDAADGLGGVAGFINDIRNCIRFTDPERDDVDIDLAIEQLEYSMRGCYAFFNMFENFMQEEEWMKEMDISNFMNELGYVMDSVDYSISPQAAQQLKDANQLEFVNDTIIQRFVDRWNKSIQYWDAGIYTVADLPEGYDSVFIQLDSLMMAPVTEAVEIAEAYGFMNVGDMFHSAMNRSYGKVYNHGNDVCAKVSVQFRQTMAMTREAFEGTLRITNGHMTDPMQNIAVNLTIKNQAGEDCTNLFQINTTSMDQITGIDGTGSLDAQTEGVVQFMMIPTIAAAPDTTVIYSFGGSFTFLDPFSGEEMTYQLYPVDLKVYPGPNLYVDYFVQRNIISDDPLTEDIIEPMEEAEIAMMIRNLGAGPANNVYLESSQPEIIENQNNLLIEFNMTGSAMNGERRPLGLTDIPFGNIESYTNGIAEWYFTSSLIGRVINSTAYVIHNSSYGNPDLSLVSGLDTHELIKAIRAYGTLEDGINDFLVNEISDFGHTPDKLYFSNGDTTNVVKANHLVALDSVTLQNNTVTIELNPSTAGWNYDTVADPGHGRYELLSCTRSDGQEIPLNNVWITHVTIPHDDIPIHENLLHIVDTLSTDEMVTYTLVYDVVLIETYEITATANSDEWGTVTGGGIYEEGTTCTLSATPAEGYAFVNWTKDGEVVSTEATYSFTVTEAGDYVGNFGVVTEHTITLEQGWNWWSSYIDLEANGLTQVENGLGNDGIYIKSQDNGFVGKDGSDWYGSLPGLHNQNMYMIQANAPVQFTMSGVCVNASQLDMDLVTGWNWIGYPLTSEQSVNNALLQLDANDGDILKSLDKMCIYDVDGWYGNLHNMNPGQGYLFYSEQPHSFNYVVGRDELKEELNWLCHWNSKARYYENNMSFIATVALNGEELRSEAYEVAAFCNGTSLGSTRLLYNARRDRYYALLPVPGEEGMKVSFRLYYADSGYEYPDQAEETCSFVINGINGSLNEPVVLHFGSESQEEAAVVQFYPNPVKKDGIVRLSLPETVGPVRVEIYNVLDVLVTTKVVTSGRFNIGNSLASGTYVLRVYDGTGKMYYGKLIVE